MAELSKSQKIKISLSIVWCAITASFAIDEGSVTFFTFFNLPLLLYWLGHWIWGDHYIFKAIFESLKKIIFPFVYIYKKINPYHLDEQIPISSNYSNYFIKHWYGELSLARSYWINIVLVNVIYNVVYLVIVEFSFASVYQSGDFGRELYTYYDMLRWIVMFPIAVWQIVGAWRAAKIYSLHAAKIWGGVAQVFIILEFMGFFGRLIGFYQHFFGF